MNGHNTNVYSKTYDGATWVAEHFRVREFACADGSDTIFIAPELVNILEHIRQHFEAPVTINSGYRTEKYNSSSLVGGAAFSYHKYGMAADISVRGHSPSEVFAYADMLLGDEGGVCQYPTFVHVDVRARKWRDKKLK